MPIHLQTLEQSISNAWSSGNLGSIWENFHIPKVQFIQSNKPIVLKTDQPEANRCHPYYDIFGHPVDLLELSAHPFTPWTTLALCLVIHTEKARSSTPGFTALWFNSLAPRGQRTLNYQSRIGTRSAIF